MLTDEQIKKIMQKEIEAKTILVKGEDLESIKTKHIKDGWELVNIVPLNEKYKVTLRKVK